MSHSLALPYPIPRLGGGTYRETSLIRNTPFVGPYIKTMTRVLWGHQVGGLFPLSEVPLLIGGFDAHHSGPGIGAIFQLAYSNLNLWQGEFEIQN